MDNGICLDEHRQTSPGTSRRQTDKRDAMDSLASKREEVLPLPGDKPQPTEQKSPYAEATEDLKEVQEWYKVLHAAGALAEYEGKHVALTKDDKEPLFYADTEFEVVQFVAQLMGTPEFGGCPIFIHQVGKEIPSDVPAGVPPLTEEEEDPGLTAAEEWYKSLCAEGRLHRYDGDHVAMIDGDAGRV